MRTRWDTCKALRTTLHTFQALSKCSFRSHLLLYSYCLLLARETLCRQILTSVQGPGPSKRGPLYSFFFISYFQSVSIMWMNHSKSTLFKWIYLNSELQREREQEKNLAIWPQEPGMDQVKAKNLMHVCHVVLGFDTLGQFPLFFMGSLAGKWIRNRAVWIRTSIHVGSQHHWQ